MKHLNAKEVTEVSGGEEHTWYVIISGYSAEELQSKVSDAYLSGFEVYGDPFSRGTFGYLYQAMMRTVDVP